MIRSQPADYGFELNEFDPFFNYRATQFIVDNGLGEYFNWNDEMSWYPNGRNVSRSSQVMLHITAATLYQIFAGCDLIKKEIVKLIARIPIIKRCCRRNSNLPAENNFKLDINHHV